MAGLCQGRLPLHYRYHPDVDEPTPEPELFVARDRARQFHRRISEVLKERRLAYRGADIGMETVSDKAHEQLREIAADIVKSVKEIEQGRVRDRERGFMETPLVIALWTTLWHAAGAADIEHARKTRMVPEEIARTSVVELLEAALRRLDAFTAAYDSKQPVGPSSMVDLEHVLEHVERLHRARSLGSHAIDEDAAFDRPPPPLRTDGVLLADLLLEARTWAPRDAGPWRVEAAAPGRPLRLVIGAIQEGGENRHVHDEMNRIRGLLTKLHPVEIRCNGRPKRKIDAGLLSEPEEDDTSTGIDCIEILLADDAAAGLETVLEACAGRDAKLGPGAEKAVRALMAAPNLPDDGPPPPDRVVALMGLLKAVDVELERVLPSRATTAHCRVTASQVPREDTRKAPVKRDFAQRLATAFEDFPVQRLSDVAAAAANGKLTHKHWAPFDAAVLLAVLGRPWRHGGRDVDRSMELDPLSDADVKELIADLCAFQSVRARLETGAAVDPADVTRMERAGIGVLGRLGRLP